MVKAGRLVVVAALAFALAGCSAPTSVADKTYQGGPIGFDGSGGLLNGQPAAIWIPGKLSFAIVTFGSSSCPPIPTSLEAAPPSAMTITFVPSPNSPCTADMAPTTHEFLLPKEMDRDAPIDVHLIYDFASGADGGDATFDLVLDYP